MGSNKNNMRQLVIVSANYRIVLWSAMQRDLTSKVINFCRNLKINREFL